MVHDSWTQVQAENESKFGILVKEQIKYYFMFRKWFEKEVHKVEGVKL